jgi:hypothetical protein
MKTLNFKHYGHLPILIKNTPRSKALEPVCLFRPPLPPIVTQSPRGEGGGGGDVTLFIAFVLSDYPFSSSLRPIRRAIFLV